MFLEKILELLLLYKKEITYSIAILIIFFIGRQTVSVDKKTVCKNEIVTNEKLFKQIKNSDIFCLNKLEQQRKSNSKGCNTKVDATVKAYKSKDVELDCLICKTLINQCK